ncbi:MAG: hypothetical protein ABSG31_10415 [Tepidisphaeraceae bacterium]|jgi:hypothetical protein
MRAVGIIAPTMKATFVSEIAGVCSRLQMTQEDESWCGAWGGVDRGNAPLFSSRAICVSHIR